MGVACASVLALKRPSQVGGFHAKGSAKGIPLLKELPVLRSPARSRGVSGNEHGALHLETRGERVFGEAHFHETEAEGEIGGAAVLHA